MIKRKLAWKPDLPDQRDYSFEKLSWEQKYDTLTLPTSMNLRPWCSEVEDQKNIGSCVANAIVGLFEYNRIKSGFGGSKFQHFSRLFSYYNARILGENVNSDTGAYIRDGIKTAKLNGICPAIDWPYRVEYWKTQPPLKCYQNALPYKVSSYYRLSGLTDMKTSISNYHPFVFGISIYESFMSASVTNTGIIPIPLSTEKLLGGHAMLAVGYDDSTQRFLVRNSWGKSWGIKDGNLQGYCTIPYTYLTNRSLADDFWTAF